MDGFAQQLANLQRAASRAGSDGSGRSSNRIASGRGRGGRGRGGNRHDDAAHSRSREDYGGGRSNNHPGRGDEHNGMMYRDNHRRERYYDNNDEHSRKRGRYDNGISYYDRRTNDYHHDNRGGSRSGNNINMHHGRTNNNQERWNHRSQDVYNKNGSSRDGHTRQPMLAELVTKVAEKYELASSSSQQTNNSSTTTIEVNKKKRRHIALLFLTIDDLPHEHIWKEWLKSASDSYFVGNNNDKDVDVDKGSTSNNNATGAESCMTSNQDDDVLVSVICHAKYPERIKSPWLRQRHLLQRGEQQHNSMEGKNVNKLENSTQDSNMNNKPKTKFHSRRPEWGSIEITRAMIDLLEEGLRIGSGEKDGGDNGDVDGQGGQNSYHRYLSTTTCDEDNTSDGKDSTQLQFDTPLVDRFIFVSESCLPVATLKELEMALFGPREECAANHKELQKVDDAQQSKPPAKSIESLYNKSWVNARSTPNNGYARQLQWDAIRQTDIPPNLIWKADQWLVLTRQHGEAIASMSNTYLEGQELWSILRKCRASDEMYFPTALSILGILHRPAGMNEVDDESVASFTSQRSSKEACAGACIRRRRITYCDWSMGAKNPRSFTVKEWRDVVAKARQEGCLFARKFVLASSKSAVQSSGSRKRGSGGIEDPQNQCDGLVTVEAWKSAVVR